MKKKAALHTHNFFLLGIFSYFLNKISRVVLNFFWSLSDTEVLQPEIIKLYSPKLVISSFLYIRQFYCLLINFTERFEIQFRTIKFITFFSSLRF